MLWHWYGLIDFFIEIYSSCFTNGTLRIILVKNSVISHEWGKDKIVITTNELYICMKSHKDIDVGRIVEFHCLNLRLKLWHIIDLTSPVWTTVATIFVFGMIRYCKNRTRSVPIVGNPRLLRHSPLITLSIPISDGILWSKSFHSSVRVYL